MKARKYFAVQISLTLIFFICLFSKTLCFAIDETQVLKVGYTSIDGFIQKNKNGEFFGYAVDYLNELSKYTNLEFEFVKVDWNESLNMLEDGDLDIVCNAKYSKERGKKYDYSDQRLGIVNAILYTKTNNNIYFDDFDSINGKRIGFIKGSLLFPDFESFSKNNNFTYKSTFYNNQVELNKALDRGEIDIVVAHDMLKPKNYNFIGNFCSYPFYIMGTKHNEYMEQINFGLSCINADNPDFEHKLLRKYFGVKANRNLVGFTKEERKFINSCPTIKIAVLCESKPMAYYNKTEKLSGITVDVLNEIAKKSGLKFEFVGISPKNYEENSRYFKSKDIDLISGIEESGISSSDKNSVYTEPYFNYNKYIVSRNGELITTDGNHTLAIVNGSKGYKYLVDRYFPSLNVITFNSSTKCLSSVSKNRADFFIYNEYLLKQQLDRPQYSNLSIVPGIIMQEGALLSPVPYEKIYKEKNFLSDKRLISVINKSINLIDQTTIQKIINNHINNNTVKLSFMDFMYKYRDYLWCSCLICFLLIGLFIHILSKKQKQCKKLSKENKYLTTELKKTKEMNNLKTIFISNISQDIKIILNNIIGVTSIAKHHLQNGEKTSDYLEKINSSSNVLLNIINDISDMSDIEIQKIKISQIPFDLKNVLTSISNIYYYKCKEKGIEFDIINCNLLNEKFSGDELRIRQILFNLLSNAYKFTDKGGKITLDISQKMIDDTKAMLEFVITDNGIGIDDEIKANIFNPYQKEDITNEYSGSGLGLTITKNIVNLMGGKIYFESQKGEGTKFTAELPFNIIYDCVKVNNFMFEGAKAIVIDEYEKDKGYVAPILKAMGMEVVQISTIKEGVQMLISQSKFNFKGKPICFIDWDIKKYNTKLIVEKIKQIYDNNVKIIAYSYDLVEEQAKEVGADTFIQKPIFQSTITKTLLSISDKYNLGDTGLHQDLKGKRILLAENIKEDSETVIQMLNMFNAEVDYAPDGKVALNKFKYSPDGTYDIILLSLNLPILDGYSLTREVRNSFHPQAKIIPIFAITDGLVCEDTCTAVLNGLNGFLSKPIETNNLYLTLSNVKKNNVSNKTYNIT